MFFAGVFYDVAGLLEKRSIHVSVQPQTERNQRVSRHEPREYFLVLQQERTGRSVEKTLVRIDDD